MKKEIKNITIKNFADYGTILEFSQNSTDNDFEILVKEETQPWRLAVFRVRNRKCHRLECHTTSMESFEPVRGVGVIIVAKNQNAKDFETFVLDKAVCLHKGIWHSMITLSEECIVKISENLDVDTEFFDLDKSFTSIIE